MQGPETTSLFEARNLHGALYRFCFIGKMEALEGLSFTEDLLKEFSKATPAQHEELGDHLVDCVSRVKSFWVRGFIPASDFFLYCRLYSNYAVFIPTTGLLSSSRIP